MLLGVNFDGLADDALSSAIQKASIEFPVLRETSNSLFDVDILPTTFVLNKQGKIVATLIGPQSEKKLQQVLSKVLNGELKNNEQTK